MTDPTDKLEQMRVTVNQDLYPELAQYLLRFPAGKIRTQAFIRLADRGMAASELPYGETHRSVQPRPPSAPAPSSAPPPPPPAATAPEHVHAEAVQSAPVSRANLYDAHKTHEVVDAQEVFPVTTPQPHPASKPTYHPPAPPEVNHQNTETTHSSSPSVSPSHQEKAALSSRQATPGVVLSSVVHPSRLIRETDDSPSAKAARKLSDNLIGN